MRYAKQLPNTIGFVSDDLYDLIGDCYQRSSSAQEWEIPNLHKLPYLAYIKSLSTSWRALRYLADWMEVSTTTSRWFEIRNSPKERERRANKTQVTLIEYPCEGVPVVDSINSPTRLKQVLDTTHSSKQAPLRVYLVEDLSQQVIELLGSRFELDPLFFQAHIEDYIWHNTRDPSASPISLSSDVKRRKWFQLRNVRFRYHDSEEDFDASRVDAYSWNVLRRPDNDGNHWSYADKHGAVASMLRTRSTIWIGKDCRYEDSMVGIVLLDPTVSHGRPLWYDRTNWLPMPGMNSKAVPDAKLSVSWYADIVEMTRLFPWYDSTEGRSDAQVIALPSLYAVCAEWLVVCDYVKTRLSQVERELELPEVFRSRGDVIDDSRMRLHNWRGVLHVFIEMVNESLQIALPAAERLTTLPPKSNAGTTLPQSVDRADSFEDISSDFRRVLEMLYKLQQHVDRLTGVVTSEISIEESRRALKEAHNMARLTWLASIFIPMTFITGLFSMTESVAALKQTFWIYFAIAVPFTGIVIRMGMLKWRKIRKQFEVATGGDSKKMN